MSRHAFQTLRKVRTGLDRINRLWPKELLGVRAGLVVHPASINRKIEHAVDLCIESKAFSVKALFGPQHGIRGETQDNMIEWQDFRDDRTSLMSFSLYGAARRPTKSMLKGLDVLIVDLQDVGARYYTFIWTLALLMDACLENHKKVVVLDRPNPIGGNFTEGPVLDEAFSSFVGLHPLPVRHGMTIGEIALYLKDKFYPGLDLRIVRMSGWKRDMWFDETGLPWVLPSPNMPALETAIVYPGMCLLEGTTLSEGRGTTRPFEIFGAPFIKSDLLVERLAEFRLPGVVFRPMSFLPTFQKHSGKLCGGAQVHVLSRNSFRPFKTAIAILKAVHDLYPAHFQWKQPPYEYEDKLLPIDILCGTDKIRRGIEAGISLKSMEAWWNDQISGFTKNIRPNYLLY